MVWFYIALFSSQTQNVNFFWFSDTFLRMVEQKKRKWPLDVIFLFTSLFINAWQSGTTHFWYIFVLNLQSKKLMLLWCKWVVNINFCVFLFVWAYFILHFFSKWLHFSVTKLSNLFLEGKLVWIFLLLSNPCSR